MASPEWMEIFRSYSPDELDNHMTALKKQISVFTTQTVGSKSYTKDLNELRGQLSAAVRIEKERKAKGNEASGVTDFSGIRF